MPCQGARSGGAGCALSVCVGLVCRCPPLDLRLQDSRRGGGGVCISGSRGRKMTQGRNVVTPPLNPSRAHQGRQGEARTPAQGPEGLQVDLWLPVLLPQPHWPPHSSSDLPDSVLCRNSLFLPPKTVFPGPLPDLLLVLWAQLKCALHTNPLSPPYLCGPQT